MCVCVHVHVHVYMYVHVCASVAIRVHVPIYQLLVSPVSFCPREIFSPHVQVYRETCGKTARHVTPHDITCHSMMSPEVLVTDTAGPLAFRWLHFSIVA